MPTLKEELEVYLVPPIEGTHPAKFLRWAHISSKKNEPHTHIIRDDWSYELKTQIADHMEQHHSKFSHAHHSWIGRIRSNKIMEIVLLVLLFAGCAIFAKWFEKPFMQQWEKVERERRDSQAR